MKRASILSLTLAISLLSSCGAPVPSIFETMSPTPDHPSCLFTSEYSKSFRIQCITMVSFYLSFKDSRSGQKLDLRQHLPSVRLLDSEGKVRYDSNSPDAGKLQLRQSNDLKVDYTGFYLRDHQIPTGKLTLEVSFKGYKPFSRTLTAEQLSDTSQRSSDIPEFEFSLDPA